ncbi:MAG: hypothetical protein JSW26_02400 [Desulfobacterales bacterium]|nr:MAG: hypothetical protein JSW26_02400 [Desulfobacterales bacterium]
MKKDRISKKDYLYQAPIFFVGLFYVLLLVWTVVCIVMIGSKTLSAGWPLFQLLMIAFVLGYTWFFSLGISYRIYIDDKGTIELTSFRRVLSVRADAISLVEGPRLALIPYSFIRFRLEREKAYLFCRITDDELQQVLKKMRLINREMKFKGV